MTEVATHVQRIADSVGLSIERAQTIFDVWFASNPDPTEDDVTALINRLNTPAPIAQQLAERSQFAIDVGLVSPGQISTNGDPDLASAILDAGGTGANQPATISRHSLGELMSMGAAESLFTGFDPTGAFFGGDLRQALEEQRTAEIVAEARIPREPFEIARQQSLDISGISPGPAQGNQLLLRFQSLDFVEVERELSRLNDDQVMQLQFILNEGGYFDNVQYAPDGRPTWGIMDEATRQAFASFVRETLSTHPGKSLSQVMAIKQREFAQERQLRALVQAGEDEDRVRQVQDQREQFIGSHPEAIRLLIEDLAVDMLGGTDRLSDAQVDELVARFQSRERSNFEATLPNLEQVATAGSEVDLFLAAISGQESGGDPNAFNPDAIQIVGEPAVGEFQFLPSTYASVAPHAGIDPNDFSPESQRKVARTYALQLFAQYGNWQDVASVWYSGGPRAQRNLTKPQGLRGTDPTIGEYIQQVMSRMETIRTQGAPSGPTDAILLDPADELQLAIRAANPAAWAGSQYADAAIQWYDLLARPGGGLLGGAGG